MTWFDVIFWEHLSTQWHTWHKSDMKDLVGTWGHDALHCSYFWLVNLNLYYDLEVFHMFNCCIGDPGDHDVSQTHCDTFTKSVSISRNNPFRPQCCVHIACARLPRECQRSMATLAASEPSENTVTIGSKLRLNPAKQYDKNASLADIFGPSVSAGRELLEQITRCYKVSWNNWCLTVLLFVDGLMMFDQIPCQQSAIRFYVAQWLKTKYMVTWSHGWMVSSSPMADPRQYTYT